MKLADAMKALGTESKSEVADMLNIRPTNVFRWEQGKVPIMRQAQIEVLSHGRAKADRRELMSTEPWLIDALDALARERRSPDGREKRKAA